MEYENDKLRAKNHRPAGNVRFAAGLFSTLSPSGGRVFVRNRGKRLDEGEPAVW